MGHTTIFSLHSTRKFQHICRGIELHHTRFDISEQIIIMMIIIKANFEFESYLQLLNTEFQINGATDTWLN